LSEDLHCFPAAAAAAAMLPAADDMHERAKFVMQLSCHSTQLTTDLCNRANCSESRCNPDTDLRQGHRKPEQMRYQNNNPTSLRHVGAAAAAAIVARALQLLCCCCHHMLL
jgi:hypothetical protein